MGEEALARLAQATVLVVGLGGVGSWCAEMLCRAGVGHMVLMDGDTVDSTNRNRQLVALASTIGVPKTQVLADRLRDINPAARVTAHEEFLLPEETEQVIQRHEYSYIVDCIDSVAPKVELIVAAWKHGVPIISAMGAGGKVDPAQVQVADISNTHNDKFARLVRRDLRRRNIHSGVAAVFSAEAMAAHSMREVPREQQSKFKRSFYGTMPYMPAVFGMHAAAFVTAELSGFRRRPLKRASVAQSSQQRDGKGVRQGGAEPSVDGCASNVPATAASAQRKEASDASQLTALESRTPSAESKGAGNIHAQRLVNPVPDGVMFDI